MLELTKEKPISRYWRLDPIGWNCNALWEPVFGGEDVGGDGILGFPGVADLLQQLGAVFGGWEIQGPDGGCFGFVRGEGFGERLCGRVAHDAGRLLVDPSSGAVEILLGPRGNDVAGVFGEFGGIGFSLSDPF